MVATDHPTIPAPQPVVDVPLAEPLAREWDDDPHTAARYDDRYWDDMYDRDEE